MKLPKKVKNMKCIVAIGGSPATTFNSYAEAQEVFPDIDIEGSNAIFAAPMMAWKNDEVFIRFEDWAANTLYTEVLNG